MESFVAKKLKQKLGNLQAFVRVVESASPPNVVNATEQRRQIIADLCRMIAANVKPVSNGQPAQAKALPKLSPRMQQTLERLLVGDSEKQIAHQLGLSRHTIHVYVKALYRGFCVSSRGELLARFVQAPTFPISAQKIPLASEPLVGESRRLEA
jgi:DNA-binding NarL/FixJ family response regulator